MPRPVKLWIGKTDESKAPPRVRLRIFLREDGLCKLSGRKIQPGDIWQLDHGVALINGGRNSEDNLFPVLVGPHKEKTKADVAEKAKTAAVQKAYLGIRNTSRLSSIPSPPSAKEKRAAMGPSDKILPPRRMFEDAR